MAYKTFAAIDVGSNQISMKIFEVSPKKGCRDLDYVNSIIELGSDTYNKGYIGEESINKLCDILNRFKKKMKEYKVYDYRAYASSAVREAENAAMVIERIKNKTGIDVIILSNSEQRFMNYKAFAALSGSMESISSKNSALLDIGAGSLQISVFDKTNLVYTQNIPIGAVRIRDYITKLDTVGTNFESVMQEYVSNFIIDFRNMFLNEKGIKSIIAIGDGIFNLKKAGPELDIKDSISRDQFKILYQKVVDTNPSELAEKYGIPYERATLMLPIAIIYQSFLDNSKAEEILTPEVTFCDGIVADYMDKNGMLLIDKDFDQDIIASAYSIAKRYRVNKSHIQNVTDNALAIFDSMKRTYEMTKRDRLQLQIACILHNCGKYINMVGEYQISYHIIMLTEILGLSHKEREEIANIVKYNVRFLPAERKADSLKGLDYMKIAKLTSILRVADVLDKSHKQKIADIKISIRNSELVITADTLEDITLESAMLKERVGLFEEVYGLVPVLRQKRRI